VTINYSNEVKIQRRLNGISQAKLAASSGVSLPMIQLIEAGKANPSLDLMEKLNQTLGLKLSLNHAHTRSEALLVHLGLIRKSSRMPKIKLSAENFSFWIKECQREMLTDIDPRLKDAFAGVLLCIAEYFPTFAKKLHLHIEKMHIDGRTIKFKRIALPPIIEILNS
jgi:transcriptional regulator with XRE-family HTH domain